jgi:hypothetical protein
VALARSGSSSRCCPVVGRIVTSGDIALAVFLSSLTLGALFFRALFGSR